MHDMVFKKFKQAARTVLSESGIHGFRIYRRAINGTKPAFVSIIGLVGDVKGYFLLELCGASALALVKAMEGHLGTDAGDEDRMKWCKAAIAEIANQIGGHAVAKLSRSGLDCLITPPTTLSGEAIDTSLPEADEQDSFTIKADWGLIHCVVAIKNIKRI